MKYSKKDRKGLIKAFEACKEYLWDGIKLNELNKHSYICFALDHAACNDPMLAEYAWKAQSIIKDCLGDYTSMRIWLVDHFDNDQYNAYYDMELREMDIAVQAHRLAWINKLIAELKGIL